MTRTVVLDVAGVHWATSAAAAESRLLPRPGVTSVEANAANQTATVTYDPQNTSVAQLSKLSRDREFGCAGRCVPDHMCDPMSEPAQRRPAGGPAAKAMGEGGGHAGMSMERMVADMRNRFLVPLVLSIPIMLWSPVGRGVLRFAVAAPFGWRDAVDDLADPMKMSPKLAAQVPAWTPGTRHGYHAITLGWYEGDLIRRADPAGRSLGRFFAEEIAKPLGLDFYIGLPASVDRDRAAHLHAWSQATMLLHLNTLPPRLVAACSTGSA